jgi:hypothetical protein
MTCHCTSRAPFYLLFNHFTLTLLSFLISQFMLYMSDDLALLKVGKQLVKLISPRRLHPMTEQASHATRKDHR